jgi:RimJ/RimL family protein N-acetyltransferase
MRIERLDPADDAVARACYDVELAARAADDPVQPPLSFTAFRVWMTTGWNGNPGEVWVAPASPGQAGGELIGWCRLILPDLENTDRAHVRPVVRPALRRRGAGRELLRHAAERARANGRTVLDAEVRQGSAGDAFARSAGAKPGIVEARRVLDLREVPAGQFARLRAAAAAAATGYTLVSWTGSTPEEHLLRVAAALNAMNDAPHDEGFEDGRWDARRVRERADAVLERSGMRCYSVAALHAKSGELAALTQVFVEPELPHWGHQGLTVATRAHRGHRLGLLTKATMLEWLASAEPKLERIDTGNAASNTYMIAVNETLGYKLAGPGWQSYQLAVSDAMGNGWGGDG